MSSIAAHAFAGVTTYLCCNRWRNVESRWALAPFIALAVAPDLDYIAVWLCNYAADPRFSHSLLFSLGAALAVKRVVSTCATANIGLGWLLTAAMSHALLDFLVAAHSVPLFWPFAEGVTSPIGVLPSAGSLAAGNVYLWRNLFIELGVLGPAFALLVTVFQRRRWRQIAFWTLLILPIWIAFVAWSVTLER